MGIFWDLMQQSQISKQKDKADSMENRMDALESELLNTRRNLHDLIALLENKFGHDIDGDGKVG